MQKQRIYEDDSYIVFMAKGWFGISYPAFMSYYVFLKNRQLLVKATSQEKYYLLAVVQEWGQLGRTGDALRDAGFLGDFAQAVMARGGARWAVFFQSQTPKQAAASYAG